MDIGSNLSIGNIIDQTGVLAQYVFGSLGQVQDYATKWIWNYNNERPNMALGGITPKQRLAMAA